MNKFLPTILLIASIGVLYWNQGNIDRYQFDASLNRMVNSKEVPPTLALTTFALGPMRSLAVDVLWWRAIQQQEAGRYYDAMQLADWITKLQPSYASVWVFHGWNMSFNISADFASAEDSWRWIDRSITLLRDEGLAYNPDNRHIRHELGRIFYDKIGGVNDVHSEYYRQTWALRMRKYFLLGTRDEIKTLRNAAKNTDELLARPGVVEYRDAAARRGIDVLDFALNPPKVYAIQNLDLEPKLVRSAASEIFRMYRRMRIEQDLKLDMDRMLMIDEEYGPLDWRLHHAHSIYWVAEEKWDDYVSRNLDYGHIIRQSMMQSFRDGRMLYIANRNAITYTNNLAIIDRIHEYMDTQLREQYTANIDSAHKNFLELAVTILYNYNRVNAARVVYDHYVEDYYRGKPAPSFESFVINAMASSTKVIGATETRTLIEATLFDSYRWIEFGEMDRSNGAMALARLIYKHYHLANPNKPLPPFDDLVVAARSRYVQENKIESESMNRVESAVRKFDGAAVGVGSFAGAHERPEGALLPELPAPIQGPLPEEDD